MTKKMLDTLKESVRNADAYSPMITQKLQEAGVTVNVKALVYAAAINYPALDELAHE
jgi:hypothetical protein